MSNLSMILASRASSLGSVLARSLLRHSAFHCVTSPLMSATALRSSLRGEALARDVEIVEERRGELIDLAVERRARSRRRELALEHALLHLHEIDARGARVVDRHQRAVIGAGDHVAGWLRTP